jgi:hypothetical protein
MRWASKQKAEIVVAVRAGTITAEQLELRYGISAEELAAWMRAYDAYGVNGLQLTKPSGSIAREIAEMDVWRTAARLIQQHGARAGSKRPARQKSWSAAIETIGACGYGSGGRSTHCRRGRRAGRTEITPPAHFRPQMALQRFLLMRRVTPRSPH